MADLTITLSFREPGTDKSDELISKQTGIPYNDQARASVDDLKLCLGKAIIDWRDKIKAKNAQD